MRFPENAFQVNAAQGAPSPQKFLAQMTPRACILGLILAVLATSSGCATYCSCRQWFSNGFKVGPNYLKPAAPVAEDWIDSDDRRVSSDSSHDAAWWQTFKDPVLNRLVDEAYQQNLSLREAGMRILEARAARAVIAGGLFPQSQSVNGGYTRTQFSRFFPQASANLPHRSFSNWTASTDLLWELDFWGRFRRAIEAADADLDASVENYDDILVMLVAEVATTYTNIRTLQQRLEYANNNVKIQKGSLHITKVQFENGAVTEVDVQQATLSLKRTESLIPQFQAQLRQQNNLLCLLLGTPPRNMLPELGSAGIPTAPPGIALGIPCELLRRRPDVRRAERLAAAQSARIGVALSDLYPHFRIRGSLGYSAGKFSKLFAPSRTNGIVSPGFSWDVLNYGRIKNNVAVHEAEFQALALDYQNVVLQANSEVEDGITNFLNSQDATLVLEESVTAADRALQLTLIQYREGAVNFNRVFTIQDTLVEQQDSYAASQGDIALGLISIYKSLGGGWQIRLGSNQGENSAPPEVVPTAPVDELQPNEMDEKLPSLPKVSLRSTDHENRLRSLAQEDSLKSIDHEAYSRKMITFDFKTPINEEDLSDAN